MSKEIGTLVVVVLKARNLHDKHSLYKQDVFAQVAISHKTKHTGVDVKGGQHPVWDEELRFPIYEGSSKHHRTLDVSCWSKEPRSAEVLGKGVVDISETLRTGEFDDWVKLELEGVYRGDLYLEMTYFASGPPPLQRRVTKMPQSERLARTHEPYAYPGAHSPPLTPPKSLFPARPSPARHDHASTSPNGARPVPLPTSAHSSPGSRHDGLPSSPEWSHLDPAAIPASLRAGPSKTRSPSPSEHPLPPLPPDHAMHTHLPSASPPRAFPPVLPLRPHHAPVQEYAPPPSLRTGPLLKRESGPYPYAPPAVDSHSPSPAAPTHFAMPAPVFDVPPTRVEVATAPNTQPHSAVPDLRKAALVSAAAPRVSKEYARAASREEREGALALAAERAEARRKEQEEQDFELARRLDLELNLPHDEEPAPAPAPDLAAAGASMPGGW